MKPIRESAELDWEGIHMSDGSPMNPESVKRSDAKWENSHQGRMIAKRTAKRQAREERAEKIKSKLSAQKREASNLNQSASTTAQP